MAVSKAHRDEVLEQVEDEGNPILHVAPLKSPPPNLPAGWADALSQKDPRKVVTDVLWAPVKKTLPLSIQGIGTTLQGLGLLETDTEPLSLIYFFRTGEETFAWRGYPPGLAPRVAADGLPGAFLDFYKVHDGFLDFFSASNGPMRSAEWHPLTELLDPPLEKAVRADLDPDRFLVVFWNGGPGYLGFDLSKKPPLPLTWWRDDPLQVVRSFMGTLDVWMNMSFEEFDPV